MNFLRHAEISGRIDSISTELNEELKALDILRKCELAKDATDRDTWLGKIYKNRLKHKLNGQI